LGDYSLALPERLLSRVENNQHVTLGMRQEAVQISTEPVSAGAIALQAEVQSTEPDYVHRTQLVHLRTGPWKYAGLSSLDVSIRAGQLVFVYAQFDLERLYLFDTRSGLRL
jgi:hypothetical protein